ncbi:zinc finger imprinted 3-like [Ambystoma mexicanum]|uniref:zinc finger imprinted 3-like n=1 Tax=Ambystoma mexicanum TaxID=8296 RepID=UPI0037E7B5DF
MSGQHLDVVSLTFCDVAASFSQDEWKLLQHWQKDLYENVMNEIQKAFLSLGPLIATSVFSLRPKENGDLFFMDHKNLEIRNITPSASESTADLNVSLRESKCPKSTLQTDGVESCFAPSTDYGTITPDATFNIKTEDDSASINQERSRRRDGFLTTPEYGSMDWKRKVCNSLTCDNTSMTNKLNENVAQNVYEKKSANSQIRSIRNQELGANQNEWKSGRNQLTHSNLDMITPNTMRPEICDERKSTLGNYISPHEPDPLQSCRTYPLPRMEQIYQKNIQPGQQRAHEIKGRYSCNECGRSFSRMSHLIIHERIHTGERPYLCTTCGKSFNQMGVLQRHQQMHTGERPYQCIVCGKRFNLKHHLVGHQKKHTKVKQNNINLAETV